MFFSFPLQRIFTGRFDCCDCSCVPCWGGVPASCVDLFRANLCLFQTNLNLELVSILISQVRILPAWKCELEFYTHPWSSPGFGFLTSDFSFPLLHSTYNEQDSLLLSWVSGQSLSSALFKDWVTSEFLAFMQGDLIPAFISLVTKSISFLPSYALSQAPRFICHHLKPTWTACVLTSAQELIPVFVSVVGVVHFLFSDLVLYYFIVSVCVVSICYICQFGLAHPLFLCCISFIFINFSLLSLRFYYYHYYLLKTTLC